MCFLLASGLAVHATIVRHRLWDLAARTWESAGFNLPGSLALGTAAVYGYVRPGIGREAEAMVVAAATLAGALCLLAGAAPDRMLDPVPGPDRKEG